MMKSLKFPTALLAMMLGSPALAYASTSDTVPTPPGQIDSRPTPKLPVYNLMDTARSKDIPAFGTAKVTLERAIALAAHTLDGKAVQAAYQNRHGNPAYIVRVLDNGRVLTASVDADTGIVTTIGNGVPLDHLSAAERRTFRTEDSASMDLSQAVALVQKNSGDRPMAADLAREAGTAGYDVTIVQNGALEPVWVSPGNPA